ncbi:MULTISPECIES: hypothetical protein [Corynebacterium]|uniref:hypothetical protein n=1 Tax=Corynebacterium TaxID=1716 RepID=UPI0016523AE7|nr:MULTISPECIES: hypothetical protein [Corynebacterium]MCQ9676715.1 hypothetical protein [Corynebacterium sp. BF-R-2]
MRQRWWTSSLDTYPTLGDFFPIAYIDGDDYAVLQRTADGVLCGRYDALDNEWWEQPAQSFTEWFYAMAAPRQNNAQPVHPRLPNTTASAPSH